MSRLLHMWFAPHDEILQATMPREPITAGLRRAYGPLAGILFVTTIAAAIYLRRRRQTAALAAVLLVPIAVRSVVMSFFLYSMPRYAIEVMPLCLVLVAIGGAAAVADLRTWRARRRSSGQ